MSRFDVSEERKRRLGETRNAEYAGRVEREIASLRREADLCDAALAGTKTRLWLEILKPQIDSHLEAFTKDVWDPNAIEDGKDFEVRRAEANFVRQMRDTVEGRASEEARLHHLERAARLARELEQAGILAAPVVEGAK